MLNGRKYLEYKIFTILSMSNKNPKKDSIFSADNSFNHKKVIQFHKIHFSSKFNNIAKYLLLLLVFNLFPNNFSDDKCHIELKVNKDGYNQILSNEYTPNFPISYKYDNGATGSLNIKYFNFSSKEKTIKLFWDTCSFTNFASMFQGLTTIKEVRIYYMFNQNSRRSNLAYMFKDCINLSNFSCVLNSNDFIFLLLSLL